MPGLKPLIPAAYNPENLSPFCGPRCRADLCNLWYNCHWRAYGPISLAGPLVGVGEAIVDRMPVVRNVYNALKTDF